MKVFRNGQQRCLCQCHPDLSWVDWGDESNPLFSCSDIDALFVAERFGQFMFIEWKHPGEVVMAGQRRLLTMLAGLPGVTVLVIHGMRGEPAQLRVVHPRRPWDPRDLELGIDRRSLERRLQRWYAGANRDRLARWNGSR